jgi:hypothetical protein
VNMNDLVLVSVDDHMVDVPKLIQREDGTDAWVFEGQEATNVGLSAVASRRNILESIRTRVPASP